MYLYLYNKYIKVQRVTLLKVTLFFSFFLALFLRCRVCTFDNSVTHLSWHDTREWLVGAASCFFLQRHFLDLLILLQPLSPPLCRSPSRAPTMPSPRPLPLSLATSTIVFHPLWAAEHPITWRCTPEHTAITSILYFLA